MERSLRLVQNQAGSLAEELKKLRIQREQDAVREAARSGAPKKITEQGEGGDGPIAKKLHSLSSRMI